MKSPDLADMVPALFVLFALILLIWGINLHMERRATRRMYQLGTMFREKMLRHAPSGTVGRFLAVACRPHPHLRWYRTDYAATLVVCPDLLADLRNAQSPLVVVTLVMYGRTVGALRDYPPATLVAALPGEIAAFREGGQAHE